MRIHSAIQAAVLLSVSLLLVGCSTSFAPGPLPTDRASIGIIQGNIHGGRQAVVGAHVFLFAAGTVANAGPGIPALASNASVSLLNHVTTGPFPTTFDSTLNAYYVTSGAGGVFSVGGEYTCTSGQQVYLYSLGGKPDGVTANSAAGFLAILGNCPSSGTLAAQVPFVNVNEVTTVAAAYAFAGFATDPTHVSTSGTALSATGIANAFAAAANLANVSDGTSRSDPAYIAGTVPQAEINTLANSLAGCVNSAGSISPQCSALFNNVRGTGATGTFATDTAGIAINIAHNPANAVATIYNNSAGIGTPFLPALTAAPNDFTIAVSFYSGNLSFPTDLAVDATGSVWVSSYSGGIDKYSPTGKSISASAAYTGGGISHPSHIAIDAVGNAWIANQGTNSVTKLSPDGTPSNANGYPGNGNLNPIGIAIDPAGFVWVSNYAKNTISKLDSSGNEVSGSPFTVPGLDSPWQIATDHAGNVWVSQNGNGPYIVELNNAGGSAGTSPFHSVGYNISRSVAVTSSGAVWTANYGSNIVVNTSSTGVGSTFLGGGLNLPIGTAVDGSGNAWFANLGGNSISEFSNTGVAISPTTGFKSSTLNNVYSLAIDNSGNIWVVNANGDNLTEFIGAATPVVTPLVTSAINNTFATRP